MRTSLNLTSNLGSDSKTELLEGSDPTFAKPTTVKSIDDKLEVEPRQGRTRSRTASIYE